MLLDTILYLSKFSQKYQEEELELRKQSLVRQSKELEQDRIVQF